MQPTNVEKGKKLISEGEPVDRLYVVMQGTIDQNWKGYHLTLGPGTVVGLSDAMNLEYEADYTVAEDAIVIPCAYKGMADLDRVFEEQPVYIFGFAKFN